jgi:hypothetical protein
LASIIGHRYEKFRGSVEGERKSKLYNEGAFLLSFRAMSATLRNPPLPFQLVIRYLPVPLLISLFAH